jgi:PAS domain S-box-containing protein
MSTENNNSAEARLYDSRLWVALPSMAGWVVAFGGALGLLGWVAGIEALKSLLPGLVTMKFNTALCFVLLGTALGLWSTRDDKSWRQPVALGCAGLAGAIGLLSLAEYGFGWNAGIDELLWKDDPSPVATVHPGRMAVNTALCFTLAALGILLRGNMRRGLGRSVIVGGLGFVVAAFAGSAFLGYATDAKVAYTSWSLTGLALPTALLFVVLGAGLIGRAWAEADITWHISRPATISLSAGLGLLVVMAWLMFRSVALLLDAAAAEAQTREMLSELHGLQSELVVMQTGVRGYALSGNAEFRKPYDVAVKSVTESLSDLERRVTTPAVRRQLEHFKPVVTEWLAFARARIEECDRGQFEAARAAIRTGQGEQLGAEMRRQIGEMDGAELRLLAQREMRSQHSFQLAFFILPLGGALTLLAVLIATVLLNREIAVRTASELKLRESDAEFRSLAETVPQIIWVTRPDGWNIYFSQQWMEYTGLTLEESLGHGWNKPFHPDDQQRAWDAWQHATATIGTYFLECRLRRADGVYHWWLIRGVPVRDVAGNITKWFGTCTDIHERKQAEAQVHALNFELEQRVRERTAELESANRELESFAYSVSHDLRAPLRGIDGWAHALGEDYGAKLDATGQEYLSRVISEAQRMGQLIDDLLGLSRVIRAEMRRDPVDLSALADEVVTKLREYEPQRQVEIVIAPDLSTTGDSRLLRQVLENLIGNAWKFTGKKPDGRIEFGCVEETVDGKWLMVDANSPIAPPPLTINHQPSTIFFIRDNGAGFDMAHATKLFAPFQRLHRQSEFPGTGIGLATVQRIIHRHSGQVRAEAAQDRGATFYFTLPV